MSIPYPSLIDQSIDSNNKLQTNLPVCLSFLTSLSPLLFFRPSLCFALLPLSMSSSPLSCSPLPPFSFDRSVGARGRRKGGEERGGGGVILRDATERKPKGSGGNSAVQTDTSLKITQNPWEHKLEMLIPDLATQDPSEDTVRLRRQTLRKSEERFK